MMKKIFLCIKDCEDCNHSDVHISGYPSKPKTIEVKIFCRLENRQVLVVEEDFIPDWCPLEDCGEIDVQGKSGQRTWVVE